MLAIASFEERPESIPFMFVFDTQQFFNIACLAQSGLSRDSLLV